MDPLIAEAVKHHGHTVNHLVSNVQSTNWYQSGAPLAIAVILLLLIAISTGIQRIRS